MIQDRKPQEVVGAAVSLANSTFFTEIDPSPWNEYCNVKDEEELRYSYYTLISDVVSICREVDEFAEVHVDVDKSATSAAQRLNSKVETIAKENIAEDLEIKVSTLEREIPPEPGKEDVEAAIELFSQD